MHPTYVMNLSYDETQRGKYICMEVDHSFYQHGKKGSREELLKYCFSQLRTLCLICITAYLQQVLTPLQEKVLLFQFLFVMFCLNSRDEQGSVLKCVLSPSFIQIAACA